MRDSNGEINVYKRHLREEDMLKYFVHCLLQLIHLPFEPAVYLRYTLVEGNLN